MNKRKLRRRFYFQEMIHIWSGDLSCNKWTILYVFSEQKWNTFGNRLTCLVRLFVEFIKRTVASCRVCTAEPKAFLEEALSEKSPSRLGNLVTLTRNALVHRFHHCPLDAAVTWVHFAIPLDVSCDRKYRNSWSSWITESFKKEEQTVSCWLSQMTFRLCVTNILQLWNIKATYI